jgi:hypothetical protein
MMKMMEIPLDVYDNLILLILMFHVVKSEYEREKIIKNEGSSSEIDR